VVLFNVQEESLVEVVAPGEDNGFRVQTTKGLGFRNKGRGLSIWGLEVGV